MRCYARKRSGDGVELGLETNVVVLLPVSAGDRALHVGALGANDLQYPFAERRGQEGAAAAADDAGKVLVKQGAAEQGAAGEE